MSVSSISRRLRSIPRRKQLHGHAILHATPQGKGLRFHGSRETAGGARALRHDPLRRVFRGAEGAVAGDDCGHGGRRSAAVHAPPAAAPGGCQPAGLRAGAAPRLVHVARRAAACLVPGTAGGRCAALHRAGWLGAVACCGRQPCRPAHADRRRRPDRGDRQTPAGQATGATYLTPSAADGPPPSSGDPALRPERIAGLNAATTLPVAPPQPPVGIRTSSPSSAAFAAAWADAHGKLTGGRYAEALAGLSVWYDDPSLGLEESQQLEDLLSRLAGTVIYSQQDLLLPPYVVAAGETLAAIAAPLGVSARLLAKINGVEDPSRLVPGEHLKLLRGPFDAVVSVSRRRLSLQLSGSYAGSFSVVIGREYLARVGSVLPVAAVTRGGGDSAQAGTAAVRKSIALAGGFVIEAAEDPAAAADATPPTSLIVSVRDLAELIDILGPGSRVLVRQ